MTLIKLYSVTCFLILVQSQTIVTIGGTNFRSPTAVFVDKCGNVFVCDYGNNAVKKVDSAGLVSTIGMGFITPSGVFVDANGYVYVADLGNSAIKIVFPNGEAILSIGGFQNPKGVYGDSQNNIYVADTSSTTVKKITIQSISVQQVISSTTTVGSNFLNPTGVFVDGSGNVFVADTGNKAIKKIDTNQVVTTVVSGLNSPWGVFVDNLGSIYVADIYYAYIPKYSSTGTSMGNVGSGFSFPKSVFVDSNMNIFVADYLNQVVKKIVINSNQATLCSQTSSNIISYTSTSPKASTVPLIASTATIVSNDEITLIIIIAAGLIVLVICLATVIFKLRMNKISKMSYQKTTITNTKMMETNFSTGRSTKNSENTKNTVFETRPIELSQNPAKFNSAAIMANPYFYNSPGNFSNGGLSNQTNTKTMAMERSSNSFTGNNVESNTYIRANSNASSSSDFAAARTVTHQAVTSVYLNNTTVAGSAQQLSLPGHLRIENDISFRLKSKLGAGGMGDIFHCDAMSNDLRQRIGTQQIVAKVMTAGSDASFLQEVAIMALFLGHNNFAQLVGYQENKKIVLMILYPLGSFDTFIRKTPNRSLFHITQIVKGTIQALFDMHDCGIVHNDIKPANILLSKINEDFIPKLTDFGVSNVIESKILHVKAFEVHNIRGWSMSYAAPERLSKAKIFKNPTHVAKSADVYSMAVVIAESLTGGILWD